MAHQIFVVISSNFSEYVEEDDVGSPIHNDAGSNSDMSSNSWLVPFLGPLYHQTLN